MQQPCDVCASLECKGPMLRQPCGSKLEPMPRQLRKKYHMGQCYGNPFSVESTPMGASLGADYEVPQARSANPRECVESGIEREAMTYSTTSMLRKLALFDSSLAF